MQLNDIKARSRVTWNINPNILYAAKDIEMLYASVGLANEAGEAAGKVKKYFRHRYYTTGHATGEELKDVADELADVLYYASRIADALNIDLEKAFTEKMQVNEQRYKKVL